VPYRSDAARLKRRWIGIDITNLAIKLIKVLLRDAFGDAAQYAIVGEPVSVPDAEALAEQDPYPFQWWALGLLGARPVEQKKGYPRRGIDDRIYFHDEADDPGARLRNNMSFRSRLGRSGRITCGTCAAWWIERGPRSAC